MNINNDNTEIITSSNQGKTQINVISDKNIMTPLYSPIQTHTTFGQILLMHTDRGGVADVQEMLFKNHEITSKEIEITQYVPKLSELVDFPLILIWTYESLESPISIGDVLADYLDAGGSVIITTNAFSDPRFDIEGRFFTDGYSPLIKNGEVDDLREYDRASTHAIFSNVGTFASTLNSEPVDLDKDATLVASYTDGYPFVAIKKQVVGMTAYPNPNYWSGDYDLIIANAINYLLRDKILLLYSDIESSAQGVSDLITPFGYEVDMLNITREIPNLVNITNYSVIISWSGVNAPADRDLWGNLMADYVDSGGSVIMLPYAYIASTYTMRGRFAEEGYSPFEYLESVDLSKSYDATSLHPILNHVASYHTTDALPVEPTAQTFSLATYGDGTVFVALRESVIGINSYIPSNLGDNIDQLLVNAIDFLLSGAQYDVISPSIQNPVDLIMEGGTTGNTLSWTLADLFPYIYELTQDENLIESGIWSDGESITINIDELPLGDYSFRMGISDQRGNFASKTVILRVEDTLSPTISSPNDFDMAIDEIRNITWILEDNYPSGFSVTHNGSEVMFDNWISGQNVIIPLDDLSLGTHVFVINATDGSDNYSTDSVSVFVQALIVPSIISPADMYIVQGDTGQKITWFIEDDNPTFYVLQVDGLVIANDSWIAMSYIELNLGPYIDGYYNFTLTIHDASNQMVSDTVMVQIYPRSTSENDGTTNTEPSSVLPQINWSEWAPVMAVSAMTLAIFIAIRRR